MCKIVANELYGTDIDIQVVRDFESWFRTQFGINDREVWWVLAYYVSRRDIQPDETVIAHLLSLCERGSIVFDSPIDQRGLIISEGMLIVPAGTVVKSAVVAAGVICSGSVTFRQSLVSKGSDVRVRGVLEAESLSCDGGAGCIVGTLHTSEDLRCEGDLVVSGELRCGGNLEALSFVRARTFTLKGSGKVEKGMETLEAFDAVGRMKHRGPLEVHGGLNC